MSHLPLLKVIHICFKNAWIISSLLENPTPAGMMHSHSLPKIAADKKARRWYFPNAPGFAAGLSKVPERDGVASHGFLSFFKKKLSFTKVPLCQRVANAIDWLCGFSPNKCLVEPSPYKTFFLLSSLKDNHSNIGTSLVNNFKMGRGKGAAILFFEKYGMHCPFRASAM